MSYYCSQENGSLEFHWSCASRTVKTLTKTTRLAGLGWPEPATEIARARDDKAGIKGILDIMSPRTVFLAVRFSMQ